MLMTSQGLVDFQLKPNVLLRMLLNLVLSAAGAAQFVT